LQKDASTHYIVFLGRTEQGKSPVVVRKMGDVEVINNPLGSGVLLDEDGNITNDANRQVGSIAMNAKGLAAAITDDTCILVCEFSVATVNGSNLAMSERTEFKSSSGVAKLSIKAVAAADGSEISSPTIVVKENDAKGTALTASNGKYEVTAGKKYYISVAATGYTTSVSYFNAFADDTTLSIALSK